MDWLTQWRETLMPSSGMFNEGFMTGLSAGLILVLLVCLLLAAMRGRRRCRGVTVAGENGSLFVTVNAVREFVARILCDFKETALHGVELRRRRGVLKLILDLEVLPDTAILPLAERLRERLISEAESKIGISSGLQVDLVVRSLSANEDKIAKQARRAAVPTKPAPPLSATPSSPESADF